MLKRTNCCPGTALNRDLYGYSQSMAYKPGVYLDLTCLGVFDALLGKKIIGFCVVLFVFICAQVYGGLSAGYTALPTIAVILKPIIMEMMCFAPNWYDDDADQAACGMMRLRPLFLAS